ncbi:MAG TPA: hypothetical protein VN451_07760, partial [Chitinophagaceae bacterium]|nr:hypothetical protein [Chitinophagaceae bacterium]
MRHGFLFFLIVSPLFSFSQLDSLKGKVKKVKDSVIYTNKSYFILSLREFDFGQLSLSEEDMFTEFKGDLLPKRFIQLDKEREYDEKGRLIKFSNFYPKINSSSSIFYTYDEYNNLVQEKHEYGGEEYEIINYHYRPFKNSTDHLTTEIRYENDPGRFWMKQYFYNDKVQLIEERELSVFGRDEKINYAYDDSGRLIAEIRSNIDRTIRYDSFLRTEVVQDTIYDSFQEEFNYYSDG